MRIRWSMVAAGVAVAVVVAGAGVALAVRPHTRHLRTPSEGMAPTLPLNSIVTANYDAYAHAAPRVGDIVVFHPPAGVDQNGGCAERTPERFLCARSVDRPSAALFIKRIVAGPGDRVTLRDARVVRNGRPMPEPYVNRGCQLSCTFARAIVVPAGQFFVLGDNRGASDDSRFWGPVRRSWIVARVDHCNPLGFHCSARR